MAQRQSQRRRDARMTGPKAQENGEFHALAFDVALRRAPDTSPIIGIAQERRLSPKEVKITKGFAKTRRVETHLWEAGGSEKKVGECWSRFRP
jgi:hypothetical protein